VLKKSLCIIAGTGATLLSSWACIDFAGPPGTPLSVLGSLSLIAIIALVVFFVVTSVTYHADGTGEGMGALSLLIAAFGGTVIVCALAAAVFGPSTALVICGTGVIVTLATLSMIALSRNRE